MASKFMSGTVCLVVAVVCCSVTYAGTADLNESFNDVALVGTVPADWAVYTRGATTSAHWVEERIPGQYALHFRRGSTSSPGTAYFTGDMTTGDGFIFEGQIKDIQGSVMVQKGRDVGDSGNAACVHVRSGALAFDGNGQGYVLGVTESSKLCVWGGLDVLAGSIMTEGQSWASASLSLDGEPYVMADDVEHRLDFSANGSTLTVSLYTTDTTPVLLGTLEYECGTHENDPGYMEPGYFGLRGVPQNSDSDVWLWNLVSVITLGDDMCTYVVELGYALTADLNHDCYVEWADFGIFASQWQECNDPGVAGCQTNWLEE